MKITFSPSTPKNTAGLTVLSNPKRLSRLLPDLLASGLFAAGLVLSATAFNTPSFVSSAQAGETPSAPGAKVYFVNLEDGATVSSPFKVIFGLSGMGVAPAGTEKEHTGHHHLFIDRPPLGQGEDGAEEVEYGIPSDENHIHFGKGNTETTLELTPGKHTLQLVLGDWSHVPHSKPVVSEVITVTVE